MAVSIDAFDTRFTSLKNLKPKAGDLIEFKRVKVQALGASGYYCHWAVYMGNGNVMHFNPFNREFVGIKEMNGYVEGRVTMDTLEKVADGSPVAINNKPEVKRKQRSIKEIENFQKILVNAPGFRYCLSHFNCEHFATFIKFDGISESAQMTALAYNTAFQGSKKEYSYDDIAYIQWTKNVEFAQQKKHPPRIEVTFHEYRTMKGREAQFQSPTLGDKWFDDCASTDFRNAIELMRKLTPKNMEPKKITWVQKQNGDVPSFAFYAGTDVKKSMYIIRASHVSNNRSGIIPGKLPIGSKTAYIPYDGREAAKTTYEVLTCPQGALSWVKWVGNKLNSYAIAGGKDPSGDTYYIGRVLVQNMYVVGKVHPKYGKCYITSNGKEYEFPNYEILIRNSYGQYLQA